MNTYIRYLMFEAITNPTLIKENDYMYNYNLKYYLETPQETFEDIENHWHIPDIIYRENDINYHTHQECLHPLPLPPLPPSPMPIKRSITVEYESCKTNPTSEHPDGIRFGRLKYASIGYYNRISPKMREMIYTLLNIKILESYKTAPQYWEGVDIKDYLYRTKQPIGIEQE